MIIDDLPDPPDPLLDPPKTFSFKAAAMVLALKKMVVQFRAAIGAVNTWLAGGAYSLPYVFRTSSFLGGANSAIAVFDVSNQSGTNVLYLDKVSFGSTVTSILQEWDDSTSTVKGQIRVQKVGDPSKQLLFNVTGSAVDSSGYLAFPGAVVSGFGSVNPFTSGDSVSVFFQRTGDKGDAGTGSMQLLSTDVISSSIASLDRLTVFTSAYDTYIVEVQGLKTNAGVVATFQAWMAKAGAVDSTASYFTPIADGGTSSAASSLAAGAVNDTSGLTATLKFRNVNATSLKGYSIQGGTGAAAVVTREGIYAAANAATGFRLAPGSGTFVAGTVRVYGVKNT